MSFLASNNSISIKDGNTEMFNTADKMPVIYDSFDVVLTSPAFNTDSPHYTEKDYTLATNISADTKFILARSSAQVRFGFSGGGQINSNGTNVLSLVYDVYYYNGEPLGTYFVQYQVGDFIISGTNLLWRVRTVNEGSLGGDWDEVTFDATVFLGTFA